jgi:hypothetical protein
MNESDRENLSFLNSLKTHKEWFDWAISVDQDDIIYASALLETALLEIDDELNDVSDAELLLKRF